MNLSDIKKSRFLKKEDVTPAVLVTIREITKENVAIEGAEEDFKVCIHFNELDKPMVLNQTNGNMIAAITGQNENIEHTWIGATIVLYNDPSIMFAGKPTGGIRVRAPKGQKPVDEVPF